MGWHSDLELTTMLDKVNLREFTFLTFALIGSILIKHRTDISFKYNFNNFNRDFLKKYNNFNRDVK